MKRVYDIKTEQDDLVIRVHQPGADIEGIQRLLDFLELEAIRKRSALGQEEADNLIGEVKEGAWERVRHLYEGGDQGV